MAQATTTRRELIRRLRALVRPDQLLSHPHELLVYETDGTSVDRVVPLAVVFPETAEQVGAIVRLAATARVPVVPRGAGTGLSGGAIPRADGLLMPLTRMKRILAIDLDNGSAVVEPGLVNIELSQAVAAQGYYYAPDPSSQKACTIGGNVAENSGGPHCLAYGVTTNHVLGMEVVLPDGEIVWFGGETLDRPGYDLAGVTVGSEGMFGIVTKIAVRLLPQPEATRTFLAIFESMETASNTVSAIIGQGIVPAALEMMDALTIRAVEESVQAGYPPDAGAVLLVEIDGLRETLDDQASAIEAICHECGAREVRVAEAAAERERLWAGRKGALGALGRLAPSYFIQDGVVPRTQLPAVLREVQAIGERYGVPIANVFHAGDGNLHPCILFDSRRAEQTERVVQAGAEILRACVDAGGSITGEHGIGLDKQDYMPWLFSEDDLEAMRKLKRAFNPDDLLNPGKLFPTGKSCGEVPKRLAALGGPLGVDAFI